MVMATLHLKRMFTSADVFPKAWNLLALHRGVHNMLIHNLDVLIKNKWFVFFQQPSIKQIDIILWTMLESHILSRYDLYIQIWR